MSLADTEVRITLRLPGKLRDRLTEAADASGRSMNGEIVGRLENSFGPSQDLEKSEYIRTLQAQLLSSYASENENLKKLCMVNERLVLELGLAIAKAADGDLREIERLIEQEKQAPALKRLATTQLFED